ncbi:PQ loop repeat-domain-containing protein [Dactylonectria estremocensis]|uniref:PQ loop repeat-domain-containing protein n=1 Tax=Dactylonectria estremocensis TaxID=1079267 RepID=A0A9P9JC46_9HYPO|nr:PQ loop repeat-domain-containing protein [Dactylonectria estremocensis]
MIPPTQTLNLDVEAISGICGSISIACWVVVFSPQIIQNFQRRSADALSIQFIIVWLLGDVFNILGAVLQGVLPTMIILAIYYTIADIVLLGQCFYYRGFTWRDSPTTAPKPAVPSCGEPNERTGLLTNNNIGDRRGSDWSGLSPAVSHIPESPTPSATPTALQTILWNATVVLMVCAAGVLGWFLGHKPSEGNDNGPRGGEDLKFNVLGQVFGYLCTVAYIASRLPQLILNWRRKTTDGLSMLFFLFACLGNITYVLSIFAYEPKCTNKTCEPGEAAHIYGRYILVNLSWLAGSLVTLFLDFGVFAQYFIYSKQAETRIVFGNEEDAYMDDSESIEEDHWDHRPLLQRGDSVYP